jgi:glycosyltransferase involved in cell wall biosynthesis
VIGIVTTSYPRSDGDSAGVFVRERVRSLVAEGHAVEIVAAGGRNLAVSEAENVARIRAGGLFYEGGAPEAFEAASLRARLFAWAHGAQFSLALARHLVERGRHWQAVESHWLVPCGVLVAALLPGLPHRAHVHGGDVFLLARLPWGDSIARVLCQSRPTLVFASASLRRRFTALAGSEPELLGARCLVEAAPFDRSLFHARSAEEKARLRALHGFSSPTVLAAGRLVPVKGFDLLVTAIGRLPTERRPTLVIAGQGPQRQGLVQIAKNAGVRLQLPGMLAQRVLAEYMAAADLFVHPCRTLDSGRCEGMPLVVREALACETPTVAFASGGLAELRGTADITLVEEDERARLPEIIVRALGQRAGDRAPQSLRP